MAVIFFAYEPGGGAIAPQLWKYGGGSCRLSKKDYKIVKINIASPINNMAVIFFSFPLSFFACFSRGTELVRKSVLDWTEYSHLFLGKNLRKNWIVIIEAKTKKYCPVLCFDTKRPFLLLQGFVIFGSV
jgi:hypothetical protein